MNPLPICFLNGQYVPLADARISPLDRGFLFADAVYEVMPLYAGRAFFFAEHMQRLSHSLAAVGITNPYAITEWHTILETLSKRNDCQDAALYWQVSRGTEVGRHPLPAAQTTPTVFAFCTPLPTAAARQQGVRCVTAADTRWSRCDIKSTALLANVMLRQQGGSAAAETILIRDGYLQEGASSAVHIVVNGELRTPPLSSFILPSVTRQVIEILAKRLGIPYHCDLISATELCQAEEITIASATREVLSVIQLDNITISAGRPGPIWQRLRAGFDALKQELAGTPW